MNLQELQKTTEILDNVISQLPRVSTCEYKADGRNWCKFYDEHLAGRCPSCKDYKLKNQTESR